MSPLMKLNVRGGLEAWVSRRRGPDHKRDYVIGSPRRITYASFDEVKRQGRCSYMDESSIIYGSVVQPKRDCPIGFSRHTTHADLDVAHQGRSPYMDEPSTLYKSVGA